MACNLFIISLVFAFISVALSAYVLVKLYRDKD